MWCTPSTVCSLILSCVYVTIDVVWIGEWIYWPFLHMTQSTNNYSATTNLHNSQTPTTSTKPFSACCVFTSHSLAMASNSEDSLASQTQAIASWPSSCNWNHTPNFWLYNISTWTTEKTPRFHCCGPTVALLTMCCLVMATCLLSHCPEQSLFTKSPLSNRSVCHNTYDLC
jgi:hypothetical protein